MVRHDKSLSWQLRSNTLELKEGKVIPFMPMLQSSKEGVLRVVGERCERINELIEKSGIYPESMKVVIAIVEDYENETK